jgi:signal transduction histidine kinase
VAFPGRVRAHFNAASRGSAGEATWDILLGRLVPLMLGLFIISLASIAFTRSTYAIAMLWPSNAVLLTVLLRSRRDPKNDGLIFLGGGAAIASANLFVGNSPAFSVALTAANMVEVATAWGLLARFQGRDFDLTCIRNLSIFMLLAGGIAPLGSAFIAAAAVTYAHAIPWMPVWWNWYVSDALGMIVVAPFLLSLKSEEWRALRVDNRFGEALGVLALIVLVAVVTSYYRTVLFVIAPALLFATFRFGIMGAAAGTLIFTLVANGFIIIGIGQPIISQIDLSERILVLQVFLAATAFWSLPVAAVLAERNRLLADLSLANARLEAEGERKSQVVDGLNRRLLNAEENERLRLSHELHDQTGQNLAAAMLELGNIEPLVAEDGRNRLQLLRRRLDEIGLTLHRIAWELRPASIDELGLASALNNYVSEWAAQYGIEADFCSGAPELDELSDEVRTAIFRVAQEGLTNIAKHARGATSVSVVIEHVDAMLRLIIEDDGCGFNTGAATGNADARTGFGLAGMRERLSLVGGDLDIESSVGTGTTIFARIPVKSERMTAVAARPGATA